MIAKDVKITSSISNLEKDLLFDLFEHEERDTGLAVVGKLVLARGDIVGSDDGTVEGPMIGADDGCSDDATVGK